MKRDMNERVKPQHLWVEIACILAGLVMLARGLGLV